MYGIPYICIISIHKKRSTDQKIFSVNYMHSVIVQYR